MEAAGSFSGGPSKLARIIPRATLRSSEVATMRGVFSESLKYWDVLLSLLGERMNFPPCCNKTLGELKGVALKSLGLEKKKLQ